MKHIQLLIGDEEYSEIQEIFKNEASFKPIDKKDKIIIETLRAVISPKNIIEEDVGGAENVHLTVKKIKEPDNKDIDENTTIKF
jgi:hypothetical protein